MSQSRKIISFALMLSLILTLMTAIWSGSAIAKPLEEFSRETWQALNREPQQATAVVFTTTDCAHCAHAIESLKQRVAIHNRKQRLQANVWVVIMDTDYEPEKLQQRHYQQADRLWQASGNRDQLQYAINPKWIGVTPYTALVNKRLKEPIFVTGQIGEPRLKSWLGD